MPLRLVRWGERGPLSRAQADLVRLKRKLAEAKRDAPDTVDELKDWIEKVEAELGEDKVREALPGEIVMVPIEGTKFVRAHNPSDDTVAFHIAIEGETEWLGSKRGSVAHEIWLRPGEAIDVPSPSWTTPATTQRNPPQSQDSTAPLSEDPAR